MIDGKRILGVICARGGSKGLPGKNVALLGGMPLVAWSVAAGRVSALLDRLVLSSDDLEILEAGRAAGCETPFVRPADLAGDEARVEAVLIHALDHYVAAGETFDLLALLQATSPFRSGEDIDACIRACVDGGAPSCVSLSAPEKSPFLAMTLGEGGVLSPLHPEAWTNSRRRQDLPRALMPNGAVYVAWTEGFRRMPDFYVEGAIGYEMPTERSVDIDQPSDLLYAQALLDTGAVPTPFGTTGVSR